MQTKVKTVVLPIAGLRTRFLPLSRIIPKGFFPLGSKPIIQYIVEDIVEGAFKAGAEKFIFVISQDKKKKYTVLRLKENGSSAGAKKNGWEVF